jgi:fructan beta-fructosidase
MTIPRTLSLEKTKNGYQILAQPLHALNQLRGERMEVTDGIKLNNLPGTFEVGLNGAEWPTVIDIENSLGETLAIRFDEDQVVVDRTQAGLADFHPEFARTIKATMPLEQNTTKLMTLLVDHSSVELFVDAGRLVLTTRVFPQEPYNSITVQGSQGWVYPLQSIWPKSN